MSAPRLASHIEGKREQIVETLDKRVIREDASLTCVADAVAAICGVEMAHVSLMEMDFQCIVGHVGMSMGRFERDNTICAYTIAERRVTVVEDATRDPRFRDNPYVTGEPGVVFYVGLPLLVDNTPVGTICAIDTVPRTLQINSRAELFGLVNAVETHLTVIYRNGSRSSDHGISSKLTIIRALAAKQRFGCSDPVLRGVLRQVDAEASMAGSFLMDQLTIQEAQLGMAATEDELGDENSSS